MLSAAPAQGRAAKEFAQRSAKGDGSQGGSKHKDVKFVGFTGVGLVIVATNTDAFENEARSLPRPLAALLSLV